MLWMLAQMDRDEALAKGYGYLAIIALIGLFTIVFFLAVFLLRRWKRRQLKAIEEDRAERRARQSGGRVDAWEASAQRYVDHDKLPPEDDLFERGRSSDDESPQDEPDEQDNPGEEDRDPFGLFKDMPFQEAEDEEDEDDEDEDWDDDDELDKQ